MDSLADLLRDNDFHHGIMTEDGQDNGCPNLLDSFDISDILNDNSPNSSSGVETNAENSPNGEHSFNGEHSPNGHSPNGYSTNGYSPNGYSLNGSSPHGCGPHVENSLNSENSPGNYFGLDEILSPQNSTFQNSLENTSYQNSNLNNKNPHQSDAHLQNPLQNPSSSLRSNSIPNNQPSTLSPEWHDFNISATPQESLPGFQTQQPSYKSDFQETKFQETKSSHLQNIVQQTKLPQPITPKRIKLSETLLRQNASSSDHSDSGIQQAKNQVINQIKSQVPQKTVYIQLRNNRTLGDLKNQNEKEAESDFTQIEPRMRSQQTPQNSQIPKNQIPQNQTTKTTTPSTSSQTNLFQNENVTRSTNISFTKQFSQNSNLPNKLIESTKNLPNSYNQPMDINDIDPNKQLFIPNQVELKRLLGKGILFEKRCKKTGQKTYELNVEELRKQQRRQKNRASASESRRRQRDYIKLLEDKVTHLEKENAVLKERAGVPVGYRVDEDENNTEKNYVQNQVQNQVQIAETDQRSQTGKPGDRKRPSVTVGNSDSPKPGQYIQVPMSMINRARGPNGQVTLLLTCLACCMCLLTPSPTLFSSNFSDSKEKSSSFNSHSILKRSVDSNSDSNSNFNSFDNIFAKKPQSSYNSRSLFEFSPGLDFTPDLETLLSSPLVQEELESRIKDGKICTFMFENYSSKMRLFQKESAAKADKNLTNRNNETVSSDCVNDSRIIYDNSTHIHNDFLQLSNIFNKTVTFEKTKKQKRESQMNKGGRSKTLEDGSIKAGVEVHLSNKKSKHLRNNQSRKGKKNTKKEEQATTAGEKKNNNKSFDDFDSSYKAERKRVHEIVSSIIAQQTQQLSNDTIFFYTNLDDYTPQFLQIPSQPKLKPKMSFYVSTPFEGQATVLNNSYIIKDTIIMRIDCEVFHTEYIGHGSQPDTNGQDDTVQNDGGNEDTDRREQPNLSKKVKNSAQNSTKL